MTSISLFFKTSSLSLSQPKSPLLLLLSLILLQISTTTASSSCKNYNCVPTLYGHCRNDGSNFTQDWFNQRLDHFDYKNNVVFGQVSGNYM